MNDQKKGVKLPFIQFVGNPQKFLQFLLPSCSFLTPEGSSLSKCPFPPSLPLSPSIGQSISSAIIAYFPPSFWPIAVSLQKQNQLIPRQYNNNPFSKCSIFVSIIPAFLALAQSVSYIKIFGWNECTNWWE